MKQLIAIDIGNSTLSYGVFDHLSLKQTGSIELSNIPSGLARLFRSKTSAHFIISSVVPKKTREVCAWLKKNLNPAKIFVVGGNIRISFPMRYDKSKLGLDRLVNLYGAVQSYPVPFLVVDFGTAITFDYVSEKGIFEGGLIVPGVGLSAEALLKRAALLPKHIPLHSPKSFLGRTTEDAFLSGLLNGFGFLADGLIGRFRALSKAKLTVLATGGFSPVIRKFATQFDRVDSFHTLKSLALIAAQKGQRDCENI